MALLPLLFHLAHCFVLVNKASCSGGEINISRAEICWLNSSLRMQRGQKAEKKWEDCVHFVWYDRRCSLLFCTKGKKGIVAVIALAPFSFLWLIWIVWEADCSSFDFLRLYTLFTDGVHSECWVWMQGRRWFSFPFFCSYEIGLKLSEALLTWARPLLLVCICWSLKIKIAMGKQIH